MVGYTLYYGTNSGSYQTRIDVGSQTYATIQVSTDGATYFFVASAYTVEGVESLPSNEVSYTVPNNLPTIVLTAPLDGASYTAPAIVNLAASVTDNSHSITKVQFYNGATLLGESASTPYSFTWSDVSAGSYSVSAVLVFDSGSTATSAPASLSVTNTPPTIALTAPLDGSSYTAPAIVNLAASVTDNSHSITKVQFYNGATLLGESASTPYSFTWSNVSASSYSVSAVLVYDAGSTAISAPASVTVTNSLAGEPPGIGIRVATTGETVLTVTGQIGHTYDIEATADFTAWTVLGTVTLGAGASLDFTDTNAASFPQRFYRTHETQP